MTKGHGNAHRARYRVVAPAFVNGSLVEPLTGAEVIIEAAAGLQGKALVLVEDSQATPARPAAKAFAQRESSARPSTEA